MFAVALIQYSCEGKHFRVSVHKKYIYSTTVYFYISEAKIAF